LKNQVNEKEESCHNTKEGVVDLRRKVKKSNAYVKFMNNSIILDEILDSHRLSNDKFGLGYNKEVALSEVGTPKKHDVGLSFSKGESKVA
jgi:hypothetical protein